MNSQNFSIEFFPPKTPEGVEKLRATRAKLAEWITDAKNESFSGAMVNRLWRHYLGVGLVEPVDDLRASNPPSNPEPADR